MTDRTPPIGRENHDAASKRESRMNSIRRRKLRKRRAEMALLLAEEALLAHHQWCGFNPNAPGNSIYNRAMRAIQEARRDCYSE